MLCPNHFLFYGLPKRVPYYLDCQEYNSYISWDPKKGELYYTDCWSVVLFLTGNLYGMKQGVPHAVLDFLALCEYSTTCFPLPFAFMCFFTIILVIRLFRLSYLIFFVLGLSLWLAS